MRENDIVVDDRVDCCDDGLVFLSIYGVSLPFTLTISTQQNIKKHNSERFI